MPGPRALRALRSERELAGDVITFYATAAAGTEDVLARELLSLDARGVRTGRGVVRFAGEPREALRACLWLRSAMRVLWPIAAFPAVREAELYDGVRAIDWREHLDDRQSFAVDATGKTEALRHTHFTALRVKDAIVDSLRDATGSRPSVDPRDPDVRVVAHLARGRCEVSLDVSGDPLFKRGYRVQATAAPLKETLAAAVLLAVGYDGATPLADPMCGSGTLAIEAALIAQNRAPGLGRRFGIERWKLFDAGLARSLRELRDEARAAVRRGAPPVFASDRDPEAVRAAAANVKRAGLAVRVSQADARALAPLSPPGWVVVNPPYGERLGESGRKALKTFFWQLGRAWRALHRHRIAVLAGSPDFESAFGMRPVSRRRLYNGPIECELLRYDVA